MDLLVTTLSALLSRSTPAALRASTAPSIPDLGTPAPRSITRFSAIKAKERPAIIRPLHMQSRDSSDDPDADLFLKYLSVIERVVAFVSRRNHLDETEADDFASHVRLKLLANDRAILKQFAGRSSAQTFLSIVVQRIFLDYRRACWGKWRPSAAATRLGGTAILTERLRSRDGRTADEVFELLTTNYQVRITRPDFERLVEQLPDRSSRSFETDEVLSGMAANSVGPDEALLQRELAKQKRQIAVALQEALARLPNSDRLLLTMRFEDGRSVAEIATALRLDQRGLYRRIDKLLKSLRREIPTSHLSDDVIGRLLEAGDTNRATSGEKAVRRPSVDEGAPGWR
jgi:RNA polymerase sigma factor (sigma-70 family)